jgi:hypothetical protein
MKYKVEISSGCTASAFTINGKDWCGSYEPTLMSDTEREEFVEYLFATLKNGLNDGTVLLTDLINCFSYDDYEYSDTCEQCGDSVETKIWEL